MYAYQRPQARKLGGSYSALLSDNRLRSGAKGGLATVFCSGSTHATLFANNGLLLAFYHGAL